MCLQPGQPPGQRHLRDGLQDEEDHRVRVEEQEREDQRRVRGGRFPGQAGDQGRQGREAAPFTSHRGGRRQEGQVGVGVGKAKEVIAAGQKSAVNARRNIITVPTTKYLTFPHR